MVLGGALTFSLGQVMVKRLGLNNVDNGGGDDGGDDIGDDSGGTQTTNKPEQKSIGGFALLTWLAVMATPQLFVASILFESGQIKAITTASAAEWSSVLYLGVVMTALGYGHLVPAAQPLSGQAA